jgi:hypothetical protein
MNKVTRPLTDIEKQTKPLKGELSPTEAAQKIHLLAAQERLRLMAGNSRKVKS